MHKMLALVASLGLVAPLFAAEGDTTAFDTVSAKATSWLSGMVTSITTFVTDNITSLLSILGIAAGLTVLWMVWKMFRKGSNKIG